MGFWHGVNGFFSTEHTKIYFRIFKEKIKEIFEISHRIRDPPKFMPCNKPVFRAAHSAGVPLQR